MRTTLLCGLAAGVLMTAAPPAHAFLAGQNQITLAKSEVSDVVEIKRSRFKHRPAGWSRGKAWWKRGGRGVPPGQR